MNGLENECEFFLFLVESLFFFIKIFWWRGQEIYQFIFTFVWHKIKVEEAIIKIKK